MDIKPYGLAISAAQLESCTFAPPAEVQRRNKGFSHWQERVDQGLSNL